MKTLTTILAAGALFAGAQSSQALVTTFFGEDPGNGELGPPAAHPNSSAAEAAFLSILTGSVGTEQFEGFANNQGAPLNLVFPGAGNATLLGNGSIQQGVNNVGRFPISGTKWWFASDVFAIDFDAPVAAFGFYGVDIGDFNGQIVLAVDGVNGDSIINVGNSINVNGGGVLYFAYVNTDNPFTRIVFGNTNPQENGAIGDGFGFDDMTIGSINQVRTPEAGATVMLLGAAVAGMSLLRRKK